jgi:two-component system response regulator VicR
MLDTKILIVDDDTNICDLLKLYFENEGYAVKTANDGAEGLNFFKIYDPDIVLLDIMLPKKDGWQVCREIREMSSKPIIMVTAKEEADDKVMGLELGADDYVTKPFSIKVLLARIKANIRRFSGEVVERVAPKQEDEDKIVIRELVIDNKNFRVTKSGREIELSNKEYELLYFLASHADEVFEREELLGKVWGYDNYYGAVRTVDVTMSRLRAKIEEKPAEPEYIITKRSKGYYIPK